MNGNSGQRLYLGGRDETWTGWPLTLVTIFAILVGVLFRGWYILEYHPPTDFLYSDMGHYYETGKLIFGDPDQLGINHVLWPPGQAIYLGLFSLFDETGQWATVGNFVLSVLTIFLMAACARLLFGKTSAALTAIATSLYFNFVNLAGFFLSENLFIVLLLLAFLCVVRCFQLTDWKPRAIYLFVAGICLGLAAVTRSLILVCALLIGIYILYRAVRSRDRSIILLTVFLLMGMAIVLGPSARFCTSLNDDRFCLVSNYTGLNLYMGSLDDVRMIHFRDKARDDIYYWMGTPLANIRDWENEIDLYIGPWDSAKLTELAWLNISADPVAKAMKAFSSLFDTLGVADLIFFPGGYVAEDEPWQRLSQQLFLVLIFPAAMIFLFRTQKTEPGALSAKWLLFLPVAGLMITVMIFKGEARYRIPFDCFFILMAARFYALQFFSSSTAQTRVEPSGDASNRS